MIAEFESISASSSVQLDMVSSTKTYNGPTENYMFNQSIVVPTGAKVIAGGFVINAKTGGSQDYFSLAKVSTNGPSSDLSAWNVAGRLDNLDGSGVGFTVTAYAFYIKVS